MKQLLFAFVVLCAFCSCAKNYPQLVKDRAAQYEKEGKVILAQSDDKTGKEHYVIYGDPKAQVLGVDTLGDSVNVIKLGYQDGFTTVTPFIEEEGKDLQYVDSLYGQSYDDVRINGKGQFYSYDIGIPIPLKAEFYKDKYVVLSSQESSPYIFFFDKPLKYHFISDGVPTIDKNGNMSKNIGNILKYICGGTDWIRYMWEQYKIVVGDYEFNIKITISPDGEITPADHGIVSAVEIPTEAFSSYSSLSGYMLKIAHEKKEQSILKDIFNEDE